MEERCRENIPQANFYLKNQLMKIYTKTGDHGETGLLGGRRVEKDHPAIRLCGDLDETNAGIGWAIACGLDSRLKDVLESIQQDLFIVGSHVAAHGGTSKKIPGLPPARTESLEQEIDRAESDLPAMTAFILPGGSKAGAVLHMARTICRRAERSLVTMLHEVPAESPLWSDLVYLNRLADLLFVLARLVNLREGKTETKWLPGHSAGK